MAVFLPWIGFYPAMARTIAIPSLASKPLPSPALIAYISDPIGTEIEEDEQEINNRDGSSKEARSLRWGESGYILGDDIRWGCYFEIP